MREDEAMAEGGWIRVAGVADIAPGEMMPLDIGGKPIALFHLEDGAWHATDNICTHAYALLTDGWLEDHEIECPLHAGRFDVRTGAALCAPLSEPIATHRVRVEGEDVMVLVG
jgi:nitrite reductase/ring-hydroxylating ferredoxin subunit